PAEKDEKIKIRARLLNQYAPGFLPTGTFFKLTPPTLEIRVGTFNDVYLLTDLTLSLSSKITLTLPLQLNIPAMSQSKITGVTVSADIPGLWKDPLGLKGLSIGNLSLAGKFCSMPTLALSGILDLGKGYKFDLTGALSFTSPVALSALRCKLSRVLSLGDLIEIQGILMKNVFPKMPLPSLSAISLPIDELKVKDPEFCIAEVDVPPLGIQKGITVKGTLLFGAVELGGVDFWMLADKGVRCKAWVKRFKIGDLTVSGAGADKKDFTADDSPIIDLEYWPATQPPYTLKQHCYLSGRADLLGAHLKLFLDIAKDRLRLDMTGDFGDLLQIQVKGQGEHSLLTDITKGGSLSCSGKVQTAFIETLERAIIQSVSSNAAVSAAVKVVGSCLLTIRSISVSGSLDQFAKGSLPSCSAEFAAFGQGFTISLPNIPNTGLANTLKTRISEKITSLAAELVKDPIAFVGKVFSNVVSLGEDVGRELVKVFGQSPAETWKDAEKQAEKQAEKARQAAETSIKVVSQTATDLANAAASTAKKVADTMTDIATGAWDTISGWFS
ncbi:MAG TPA: hypothetical protein PKO06_14165, partial [Candidatus Ozemobacteraceae bacterium]|nr:hypothetical protein [Candidatus Ozemobacteraceae bacterium]